ncbi:MAG: hypothetical protein F2872_03720 [Actinobacteria bacterium]|nr:hypothetical protein [Actinomycetota bacterium]
MTNVFRVISTPVLEPASARDSGFRVGVTATSVPAVTGKQDVTAKAGVQLGTPVDEGGGAGGGVSDDPGSPSDDSGSPSEGSGSPLAKTGADLVIPTAILGMLLVGLGIGSRRLGRATR